MRKRRAKRLNPEAMGYVERTYARLAARCAPILATADNPGDVFQDTVLFVSSDAQFARVSSDDEFVEYFARRLRMIAFQARQDKNEELRRLNAYNRETQEEQAGE